MGRGVLRTVLRRRPGRFGAYLALLVQLLIGVAPLWLPAVERAGVQICTADGARLVVGGLSLPVPSGDTQTAAQFCPLCILSSAHLIVAAEPTWQPPSFSRSAHAIPLEPCQAPPRSTIAYDRLCRAPPALS